MLRVQQMAILMDICVIIAFLIAVAVGKVTKKFNIPVHLIVLVLAVGVLCIQNLSNIA